jgi:putative effector of murein hydrolase
LWVFRIDYASYAVGGDAITAMLPPITVCLALPIYRQRGILRKNLLPILVGTGAGALASMGSIYLMCRAFGLDREILVSVLPKSVTTPIDMAVSSELGGITSSRSWPFF